MNLIDRLQRYDRKCIAERLDADFADAVETIIEYARDDYMAKSPDDCRNAVDTAMVKVCGADTNFVMNKYGILAVGTALMWIAEELYKMNERAEDG